MGIDTSAKLMVGLQRGSMEVSDELAEMIDSGEIDTCSTYYDGGGADSEVIGFCVAEAGDYCASEVTLDLQEIETLKAKFKELTGKDAKLLIAPHVW